MVVRGTDVVEHLIAVIGVVGAAESSERVEVYADLREEWLQLDEGQAVEFAAGVYPVRIRLTRDGDTFRVDGVDRPKDGSGYLSSLDDMFPAWARGLVDTEAAAEALERAARAAALEWAAESGLAPPTSPTTTLNQ